MLILNTCSFQKKILSNLTCVLIYLFVFLKIVLKAAVEIYPQPSILLSYNIYICHFLNEAYCQIQFLRETVHI